MKARLNTVAYMLLTMLIVLHIGYMYDISLFLAVCKNMLVKFPELKGSPLNFPAGSESQNMLKKDGTILKAESI
jgi:hypothetical protein